MPRHPVLNRRNLRPLARKTLSVSPEAVEAIDAIAKALWVSQGSLVDTALRHLAQHDPDQIVELLRAHGHLSDAEHAAVQQRRGAKP